MRKILNHFEEYVAAVAFMSMLGLAFANVVMRNFATAISFSEEITTSLFVLLCTLGTAIAARDHDHLGLSVVTEFLPERVKNFVLASGNALGVVFGVILVITGIQMVIREYELKQISIALQWPQWIYGSFLPIGAVCMCIRFTQAMVENIKKFRNQEDK